ncbi:type II secretion system minor pseudopilin GspK [uncultured Azohydromonas sp.]|jgi:Type II secretory pathway, component PulK|uniref:type II secretion system minor pseudopilin GspK n=1 Tax=uncultured Azohydromonas sp. TaxID=487342 RepID=UPI00261535C2|nr:type II secretion system minor pseudopilin GspK [uncultured Azohydromonas sp.]
MARHPGPTRPGTEWRRTRRPSQAGAALLIAMVLVTVVTTLAAGMVWQQWRAVEVEAAERARSQSAWILNGALDWARLILREDGRTGQPVDHLGEPWSVPLAEARLSTFLAAERSANADDGPEAFLSGDITDAQSRYNLRKLVGPNPNNNGFIVEPKQLEVLRRLLGSASLSPDLAAQIANQLRQAIEQDPQGPLMPRSLDQLAWLGLDESTRAKLEPFVVLLPEGTNVNLNTAPREVLAAVIGLNLGDAQRLVQRREQQPFNTAEEAKNLFSSSGNPAPDFTHTGANTNYFEVRGRLRLGDQVLMERSLVHRAPNGVTVLRRERINATATLPGTGTALR